MLYPATPYQTRVSLNLDLFLSLSLSLSLSASLSNMQPLPPRITNASGCLPIDASPVTTTEPQCTTEADSRKPKVPPPPLLGWDPLAPYTHTHTHWCASATAAS